MKLDFDKDMARTAAMITESSNRPLHPYGGNNLNHRQFKKAVEFYLGRKDLHFDSLMVSLKDRTITVKRGYFYRHGLTPSHMAVQISKAFTEVQIVDKYDDWKAWPKTSNFVVKFKIINF